MLTQFVIGAFGGLLVQQLVLPLVRRAFRLPRNQSATYALIGVVIAVLIMAVYAFVLHDWFGVGLWTVAAIYELWQWWDSDDNQWRRKQQAKARRHVRLRTFRPSPIPQPGS